jgi:hypothetical protein
VDLRGEHDVVTPSFERLADDLLRLAGRVHVGRVDEVDARVERRVDDSHAVVVIGVADSAEHHRAETVDAHLDAGATQYAIPQRSSPCLWCADGTGWSPLQVKSYAEK